MANSPLQGADGPVRLSVTSDGNALADSISIISVDISKALNRVPLAVLTFSDGDMPAKDFPLSNQAALAPGAQLVISAGYGDDEQQIFSGVVVKHSLAVSGDNQAKLVIECRDAIFAATLARNNANYINQTDSEILQQISAKYPVSATVAATTETQAELVQYYCTDWDFMLLRAEVNGMVVAVDDGKLDIAAPDVAADAVLKVTYGDDLLSFNASLDASQQFDSVKSVSWDHNSQQIQHSEAAGIALTAQGNISGSTLAQVAAVPEFRLQSTVPLSDAGLTGWAKAQQLKSALARIRGELRCQGSALLKPGVLLEVNGVGERFNGKVFVAQVRHIIADGDWISQVSFGMSPQWFAQSADISAPLAGGVLPGVNGLQIGVVMKLDADPDNAYRIQVNVPVLQAETAGIWARLLSFYASSGFGQFCLPEIGDEVILGYLNNDPCYPVILGSVYSSKRKPAYEPEAENNIKAFVSRTKLTLEYDEEKKKISILTPAGNKAVLDDDSKTILLQDQHGNKVELSDSGILLDSPKDISLNAKGKISLQAVNNIELAAQADFKAAALNISQQANAGFTAKGNASAELSASGQTTVKGAMVMIN
ncbi:type VI secretion system tip protein VgrG [Rheinheimera sp. YQF-2]|uniref:Type VI secretion system tip protein VgrG n=1 Tax=Rheinheimera lutimaris TaxID=2740584 RepID=A0A7Y5EIS7_9GAMM|nr:type VI secretion system tip protein VgrG [Rheinheimera lutimaris]NRQ43799.1 type VI secretion system tip protein VgrG [Rheinheimera lutimaris]